MLRFLFTSRYRWAIYGLLLLTALNWWLWQYTDQVASVNNLEFVTGAVLLNIILAYFSNNRLSGLIKYFFIVSYVLLLLTTYSLYLFSKGVYS